MKFCGLLLFASGAFGMVFDLTLDFDDEDMPEATWYWGGFPKGPASASSVADAFPEHGVIKIAAEPGVLQIKLVKRPPANIYPTHIPFCQRYLPAAILSFLVQGQIPLEEINRFEVRIDANPASAACKCYLRTMTQFGFSNIPGKGLLSRQEQDEYCEGFISDMETFVIATRSHANILPFVEPDVWEEIRRDTDFFTNVDVEIHSHSRIPTE